MKKPGGLPALGVTDNYLTVVTARRKTNEIVAVSSGSVPMQGCTTRRNVFVPHRPAQVAVAGHEAPFPVRQPG